MKAFVRPQVAVDYLRDVGFSIGKDTLQQNADAPNKLNLATKNGDVEVEFVR